MQFSGQPRRDAFGIVSNQWSVLKMPPLLSEQDFFTTVFLISDY